jgi:hypothetical protein
MEANKAMSLSADAAVTAEAPARSMAFHWVFAMVRRSRAEFESGPVAQRRKLRFKSRRLTAMPAHNAI